jgi:hypothetical protein
VSVFIRTVDDVIGSAILFCLIAVIVGVRLPKSVLEAVGLSEAN